MTETPDQENARLLGPYTAARDAAAQAVLEALLSGRYEQSQELLIEYQMTELAYRSAMDICRWFDEGVANDHVSVFSSEPDPDDEAIDAGDD
jgi:hypothetical protein